MLKSILPKIGCLNHDYNDVSFFCFLDTKQSLCMNTFNVHKMSLNPML